MLFFLSRDPPGIGPELHRNPCEETFNVEEGKVRFTVGEETIEARAGEIVVVSAGRPHKFLSCGQTGLRQISIHPVALMVTEWLAGRELLTVSRQVGTAPNLPSGTVEAGGPFDPKM